MNNLTKNFFNLYKSNLLFCFITSFILIGFNITNIYQSLLNLSFVKILIIIFFKIIFQSIFIFFWLNIFSIFIRKKITLYYIVFVFSCLLSIINYIKVIYLATPLNINDIFLVSETLKVIDTQIKISAIFILIILVGVGIICFFKAQERTNISLRIFLVNLINIIILWIAHMLIEDNITNCQNINIIKPFCNLASTLRAKPDWRGELFTVKENGFMPFFTYKLGEKVLSNINKEYISENEITNILKVQSEFNTSPKVKNPTIIILIEESFSDPRFYDPNLSSEDFTFIDSYKKSNFLSPVFGGGTANAEFEILTGLNISFYPNELMFVSNIKRPTYSLAYALKNRGYQTYALHNFPMSIYNRNTTYPLLGFDKFYSLENLSTKKLNADFTKDDITDDLIYEKILDILHEDKRPKLIYALTVKNHGKYEDNRYGSNEYNFSIPLNEKDKQAFGTYTSGVKLTNVQLNNLVKKFEKFSEPILLVVLGDHHPFIKNISELNEKNINQLKNYYTPLMFWDNYHADYSIIDKSFVSSHFITPKILQIANMQLPNYFNFIDKVSKCFDTIHNNFTIKNPNCKNSDSEALLNNYKKLNKDILEGENYAFKLVN